MNEMSCIYKNVNLGSDTYIGAYAIIGVPPKGTQEGEMKTIIGDFAVIRSHTVIYAGNDIGNNFQTGHSVMIREMNEIGHDVSIGTHSVVEHDVCIGNGVRLHTNVFVPEYSVLEDDVWVGPNVVFTNAKYPRSRGVKERLSGPHLYPGAKIGANSTLLPGVVIGRNALVGAGSVVVDDVPDEAIVVGNPARIIGKVIDLPFYQTD